MPVSPPKRPVRVDSLGSLDIGKDGVSTQRAIDALIESVVRGKQAAASPTVTRVTLAETKPVTSIELSLYTDGTDAYFLDGDGNRIQLTSNGAVNAGGGGAGTSIPYSTYWYSPIWVAGNVLDTRGPSNDVCRATYMGRAPEELTQIGVRWSQTAGGTITYAEWGIATGSFVPGTPSSLVLRGYVDSATEWASSGLKQKTITVTGDPIAAGDDIWLCYSVNFSAGAPTIAVSNLTDRLDSNQFLTRAATRISTNLNTAPLAFTAENVTPVTAAFFLI